MYPEGKAFIAEARRIAAASKIQILEGPVCLSYWLWRSRDQGDLMNVDKALCDALEGFWYVNDKQIKEHHAYCMPDDPQNPRVEVLVRALN